MQTVTGKWAIKTRNTKYSMAKDTDLKEAVKKFVDAFEQVFDKDWDYTKDQLGIHDDTLEQKQNIADAGLETIYMISPDGTFINPNVDNEVEDWGHRALLLDEYRRLKKILADT